MKSLLTIVILSMFSFAAFSEGPAEPSAAFGVSNLKNHLATPKTRTTAPDSATAGSTQTAETEAAGSSAAAAIPVSTEGLNLSSDEQAELQKQLKLVKESQEKAEQMIKEMEQE